MDEPKGHYAKTRQMLHDLSYIDYTSFSEAEVIEDNNAAIADAIEELTDAVNEVADALTDEESEDENDVKSENT